MQKIQFPARAAAVALGLLIAAAPVMAQGTTSVVKTKGFMVGAHLNGTSISSDEDGEGSSSNKRRENGGGAGAVIGWGFTKWFMLYAGVDAAKIEIGGLDDDEELEDFDGDFTLVHADFGARFSFPSPNHGWVPYLNAAVSSRVGAAEFFGEDISISGSAITAGGGVQYFFNPKLALDVGLQLSVGKFDKVEVGGVTIDLSEFGKVENTNTARFNVGMRFYPHFGGK